MKLMINFTLDGIHFEYKVFEDLNIIYGDSGIGKTYFIDSLKDALKAANENLIDYPVKEIDTDKNIKTLIFDGISNKEDDILKGIKNMSSSLVIIDEAAFLLNTSKSLVNHIGLDNNNTYIIVTHAPIKGLVMNYSGYAIVKSNKKEIIISN